MPAMRPNPRAALPWWPRPSPWAQPANQRASLPAPRPHLAHRPSVPPGPVRWLVRWFVHCPHCRSRPQMTGGSRALAWLRSPQGHRRAPAVALTQMQAWVWVMQARSPSGLRPPAGVWAVAHWLGWMARAATTGFATDPPARTAALEFAKPLRPASPPPPPDAAPRPPKPMATRTRVPGPWPCDGAVQARGQPWSW
jgi:hypothetical protein